jgi:endoglucanase
LIDIGSLYYYSSQSSRGITTRIDKVLSAGLQPHVIRLPIYPRTVPNGEYPAYSPAPFPLGPNAPSGTTTQANLTMDDYFTKVLKPAVDYATQKGMYVIVDYHQIDDTDDTARTSASDANTFWQYMAPKFKDAPNVIYEAYNEPMDTKATWSTLKPRVQKLIDTIRAAAPDNIIIVPSQLWCQRPGDAATDPPTGTNLMYTAHVYPGNWADTFKAQVATATAIAPVFFTEWGYASSGSDTNLVAPSASWGTDFKAIVEANGGSWTAWVTDNSWQPAMFSDSAISKLTDFGTLAKDWLAEKYASDWVQ